ncbi:MAG: protein nirF [Gammaproteobacteria bacterium]|nr:protein nirF [Gammaproteobacteria bacterium]
MKRFAVYMLLVLLAGSGPAAALRGSGDLGLVIERADSSIQIIETSGNTSIGRVDQLGDLSHASAVYSRDARYAYIFGRDGGLSKVDILSGKLVQRKLQSGNSIGGAISQDGRLVAVSNYKPGGVKVFDADTLELVADIPATFGNAQQRSKVIGLVDAPGHKFVFALWDADEIWVLDMSDPANPDITRFKGIGRNPYDALITPDGRYYIAGLFGEDGMALLDLWNLPAGVQRILPQYGKGEAKLPVYKMPHLEGWAVAGDLAFVPAVGRHEVLVINMRNWQQAGRIEVQGQPIFVMARPDGRQVWVNFALPDNDTIQVIDTQSLAVIKQLRPGKGVLHMEFEPRGEEVWLSVRDENRVEIYDTANFELKSSMPANKPSGIFFSARAHRIGL